MTQGKIVYLLVILGICAVTDFREKKIKNRWIILGLAGAVIFLISQREVQAVKDALLTAAVFFAVLFPLYVLRAAGAGDVKLLCTAALYIGKEEIEIFLAGVLLAGGMMSVAKMLYYGTIKKRIGYFAAYVQQIFLSRTVKEYGMPEEKTEVLGMAVPVFIGALGWSLWVYIMK